MFDLFREILQTLGRNRLRTALTGLSVAWGIFMLIVLLGASRGVNNAARGNMNLDRQRSIEVWPGMTSKPYKGFKEGRYVGLKQRDLPELSADQPGKVETVVGVLEIDTVVVQTMNDFVSGGVAGAFPKTADLDRMDVTEGRFINQHDLDNRTKVMVLVEENAKILFGEPKKAIGQRVSAMGLSWVVVGVYKNEWRRSSYIPFTTLNALQSGDDVKKITVLMSPEALVDSGISAEKGVRSTLARMHNFDPTDESAIYVWNSFEGYMRGNTASVILDMAVWIIGLLTLLSGIVGVSNIMFVSVRERTHEIGVRRAIGAKPRSILTQIVAESVAITALFGYIGVLGGILVTEGLNQAFGKSDFMKDPTVNLTLAFEIAIVLVVVGAIAGLFPAIKATKVRPVEALRDE